MGIRRAIRKGVKEGPIRKGEKSGEKKNNFNGALKILEFWSFLH